MSRVTQRVQANDGCLLVKSDVDVVFLPSQWKYEEKIYILVLFL